MESGRLKDFVRFERATITQDAKFKSAMSSWSTYVETWAEVQDLLPSRGETAGAGISMAKGPARVRTRWIDGVNSSMRIVVVATARRPERILRIVSGPAELGRMDGMEFMAESFSTPGQGAA